MLLLETIIDFKGKKQKTRRPVLFPSSILYGVETSG